jgi:hypothetical protein
MAVAAGWRWIAAARNQRTPSRTSSCSTQRSWCCRWMLGPDFKIIGAYQRSLKEYPNIKVGEDFKGYKK